MNTLELKGLDGSNPLGFLASMGALRVATIADPSARMGWRTEQATPWPVLECTLDETAFAARICAEANRLATSVAAFCDIIKVPAATFRQAAMSTMRENGLPGDLTDSDYFAAFASDAVVDAKDGRVSPTLLSFSNGGSGQNLLKDFCALARLCKPDELVDAVFHGMHVYRPLTNLNWDPTALRSYALRWKDPEKDGKETSVPLQVLGFIGLAAFTAVPEGARLSTAGFDYRGRLWTWRLWERALPYSVAVALVCSRGRQASENALMYQSQRLTSYKRYYFAPSVPFAAVPADGKGARA